MKTLLTVGWAVFFTGVIAWFAYERLFQAKPVLRVQCDAGALVTGAEWSGNAIMIKFTGRPAHWTTCAVEIGKAGQ